MRSTPGLSLPRPTPAIAILTAILVVVTAWALWQLLAGYPLGVDLEIPLRAAERWLAGEDPYPPGAFDAPNGPDLPFLYPPFLLPIIAPLTFLPRDVVMVAWTALLDRRRLVRRSAPRLRALGRGPGPVLATVRRGDPGRQHPGPPVRGLRGAHVPPRSSNSIRRTGNDRPPWMVSWPRSSVPSRCRRSTPGSTSCAAGPAAALIGLAPFAAIALAHAPAGRPRHVDRLGVAGGPVRGSDLAAGRRPAVDLHRPAPGAGRVRRCPSSPSSSCRPARPAPGSGS